MVKDQTEELADPTRLARTNVAQTFLSADRLRQTGMSAPQVLSASSKDHSSSRCVQDEQSCLTTGMFMSTCCRTWYHAADCRRAWRWSSTCSGQLPRSFTP